VSDSIILKLRERSRALRCVGSFSHDGAAIALEEFANLIESEEAKHHAPEPVSNPEPETGTPSV
jgi:hypothetical protein